MGIPRLMRHIEPFARRYTPEDLTAYTAIIDGPSLAYHAHKVLALSNVATGQSRLSSYQDVNTEAIRWLNHLDDNYKVALILFDGLLPWDKQTTRWERMEKNNARVLRLKSGHRTAECPIPTFLGSTSYCFLAPSVKEALSVSRFASVTRIVPGEADDWCALSTNDHKRVIIFTSDSDLLLYDYPPETLVALFKDLDCSGDVSEGLRVYSPKFVREEMYLKSLLPFAYTLTQNPDESIGLLLLMAENKRLDDDPDYLEFSKRYIIQNLSPVCESETANLNASLQDLDARVSELVHQALGKSPLFANVYLPQLVEDHNRASAWNLGQEVRHLAYTLLIPNPQTFIYEIKRKAQNIGSEDTRVLTQGDTAEAVKALASDVSSWITWANSQPDMSPQLQWTLFATRAVLANLKTPPDISQMFRVLSGDFDNTWEFVHLTACIQAHLYSLRMFKQITAVWLSINHDHELLKSITDLQGSLADMPSIADAFTVPGQMPRAVADHAVLRELLKEVYHGVDIELPDEGMWNEEVWTRGSLKDHHLSAPQQKRQREHEAEEHFAKLASNSNPFALLSEDNEDA